MCATQGRSNGSKSQPHRPVLRVLLDEPFNCTTPRRGCKYGAPAGELAAQGKTIVVSSTSSRRLRAGRNIVVIVPELAASGDFRAIPG